MTRDGPDIWIKLDIPAGTHEISLYFVNDEGHTVLRYRGRRRLLLVQPIEGFADFLERIRRLNPHVEIVLEPHDRSG